MKREIPRSTSPPTSTPSSDKGIINAHGARISATTPSSQKSGSTENTITEGTDQDFVQSVIESSVDTVILVDFWAPWCGPCRQLSPILHDVVKSHDEPVNLVTINVDEHPAVAGQLQVRSLPTVYAFIAGQPVDGFMGVRSHHEITAFINSVWKKALDMGVTPKAVSPQADQDILSQANDALEQGNTTRAKELLQALSKSDDIDAQLALARCMVMQGIEPNTTIINAKELTLEQKNTRDSIIVWKQLNDEAQAVAHLDAQPNTALSRFKMAIQLWQNGDWNSAIDGLFHMISTPEDSVWDDGRARTTLLNMFTALGTNHPITKDGRKRLSSILFR